MQPIYPLNEKNISRHCGQLVCAVTADGSRHIGILSSCRGGQLILNDEAVDDVSGGTLQMKGAKKAPRKGKGRKAKPAVAQTLGYPAGPFGPGPFFPFGSRVVLDLALLTLLFLIVL
ncbi:hypothetical protein [Paenibacillus abyssi]|uniref:Uncharacterized protein n=1 Tax=Paenibacillus abyssi TaxID=1340531 RepID=A0A917G3H6_9BACL|nr:hypothetical protein [Paenibacillus abyssi]GGG21168.1 hypothetical protein GCM10010916_42360 [Paenibacillus abyssi]